MAIKLIKDPLHGNTTFSNIEEKVLDSPLYNRLHHVLQNSCAYLVYPSNKTSRFTHSLGVMNIATNLFNYGISNADPNVLEKYLKQCKNIIDLIVNSTDLPIVHGVEKENYLKKINKSKVQKSLLKNDDYLKYLYNIMGWNFCNHTTINNYLFTDTSLHSTYLLLLQSLRLFALLHDFGHLPFSHLTEFALSEVYNKLNGNSLPNKVKKTQKEKDYTEKFHKFFKSTNKEIHEAVGKKLIKVLLTYCSYTCDTQDENQKIYEIFTYQIIINILDEVFKGVDSKLLSIFEIIDGNFDADKMEYSIRDGHASGLFDKSGDIERIVKLFCLATRDKEKDNETEKLDKFCFYPSLQTINDIQELFIDRYRIYKFMINHHKVKRFDYILQKCIELLLHEEFKSKKRINLSVRQYSLENMVNTIFEIISYTDVITENKDDIEKLFYQFAQLNDFWLVTLLNGKMLELILSAGKKDFNVLKILLNEFFTNSKEIKSLWKKDYEYSAFSELLGQKVYEILQNNDLSQNKYQKLFYKTLSLSGKFDNDSLGKMDFTKKVNDLGKCVVEFMNQNIDEWTEKIFEHFRLIGKLVLCRPTNLKIANFNMSLIDIKDNGFERKEYKFGEVSGVPDYLFLDRNNSVQFFVYYKEEFEPTELQKMIIEQLYTIFINKLDIKQRG